MRRHGIKARERKNYVEAVVFALQEVARCQRRGVDPVARLRSIRERRSMIRAGLAS
jgi:hypothetical protein